MTTAFYQDSAGVTPALFSGDPINLWKDRSPNANDLKQDHANLGMTLGVKNGFNIAQNVSGYLYKLISSQTRSAFTVHVLQQITLTNLAGIPVLWDFNPGSASDVNVLSPCWTQAIPLAIGQTVQSISPGQPYLDGNWHLISFVFNAGTYCWYVDGIRVKQFNYSASPYNGPTAFDFNGYNLAALSHSLTAPTNFYSANIAEAAVYSAAHTDQQVAEFQQYCAGRYAAFYPTKGRLFAFFGNSLTDGGGYLSDPRTLWPAVCMTGQNFWDNYYLMATGGATTPQEMSWCASFYNALLAFGTTKKICVCWEIGNDIVTNGASVNQAYANYVQWCQQQQAAGWAVVSMTLTPRSDLLEASRQAVNTLVRNNYLQFSSAIIDIALNTTIGLAGDNLNQTYYEPGGVHFIAAGAAIVGTTARAVLSGL